jgi:2-polyprenyl-3-methyl-5-hydroxy-6-metoxy-1,4-benzoquinol methylase
MKSPNGIDLNATPMPPPGDRLKASWFRWLAGNLARSFLCSRGRHLYERNRVNWVLPMSKTDKLMAGGYMILRDYSEGIFPPTFADQAKAYQAEIDYMENLPGVSAEENVAAQMRKPFWGARGFGRMSRDFGRVLGVLESLGLPPNSRILELGCGAGWMSEFLALHGYSVVGTSIAPMEIEVAQRRADAFQLRRLDNHLSFQTSPMEEVDQRVQGQHDFDAAVVFEALHHAFDWKKALQASFRCLRADGWLLLANEPNLMHTFISYRVARLSNTHEIGLSQKHLCAELTRCGFREIRILQPRMNNLVTQHWIAARK